MKKCEGSCEQHRGEVKRVHVKDWGFFWYCEEAIEEDRRRKLKVSVAGKAAVNK